MLLSEHVHIYGWQPQKNDCIFIFPAGRNCSGYDNRTALRGGIVPFMAGILHVGRTGYGVSAGAGFDCVQAGIRLFPYGEYGADYMHNHIPYHIQQDLQRLVI